MRSRSVLISCSIGLLLLVSSPTSAKDGGRHGPFAAPGRPEVAGLRAEVASLNARVEALEGILKYVTVVQGPINGLAGPHWIIEGVNVHVRSGSGATDDGGSPTGLGNLVIGYNELYNARNRGGSHNLVIGPDHGYSASYGMVAGLSNQIGADGAVVTGGYANQANGTWSTVSGGDTNEAAVSRAWVGGGISNVASGFLSAVSGGSSNEASGQGASVCGGDHNVASGDSSTVSGGYQNQATANASSVSGGTGNVASGYLSSVSGGATRTAPGLENWAAGSLSEPN